MLGTTRYFIGIFFLLTVLPARGNATPPVHLKVNLLQSGESSYIPYRRDNKVQVSDFKASPDHTTKGVAATYSGVQMGLRERTENGIVHIEVDLYVYFDKQRSWMKKTGRNQRVLDHEQIHFDITAVFACNLKLVLEATTWEGPDVFERLKELHKQQMQLLQETQHKYDLESKHGTDALQQKAWSDKIYNRLQQLACY